MERFLEWLDSVKQHASTVALAVTWTGILVVYLRRKAQWHRKQFLEQVNFSLNYVIEDAPAMRTLLEAPAQAVWLNEYGIKKVFAAAQKTTVEHSFIVLDDPKDQAFINRAVLNALSERFAESFVAAALGLPVQRGSFCFAITCEKYEEIRTVKLRVLIIEEQTLVRLFGADNGVEKLRITDGTYRARTKTLKAMHDQYVKDKGSERPVLGHLELGMRLEKEA